MGTFVAGPLVETLKEAIAPGQPLLAARHPLEILVPLAYRPAMKVRCLAPILSDPACVAHGPSNFAHFKRSDDTPDGEQAALLDLGVAGLLARLLARLVPALGGGSGPSDAADAAALATQALEVRVS